MRLLYHPVSTPFQQHSRWFAQPWNGWQEADLRTLPASCNCTCGDICVNPTGWWRDGGALNASTTPTQTAVDNANVGETICAAAGSYTENVDIGTSHLTLEGEGADVVTVAAASGSDHIFYVAADYVNISGFYVTGATGSDMAGVYLSSVDHCNIPENTASNNCYGIRLNYSSNNTLASNTASGNYRCGIRLSYSSNNTLANNTASSNSDYGIYLDSSSNNLVYNNYFNNTDNAYDNGNNQWNTTKTNGTNIIGGSFLGGNYWGDYAGIDNDGDGLGDTMLPYNSYGEIVNGGDIHPLTEPAAPPATYIPPDPTNLQNTVGSYWVNYTWSPGTGNVTDSYNVNLNGIWTNGTTDAFANISVGPSGWANVTVFAYNASGTGTLSSGSVSDEVQAPAAPAPIVSYGESVHARKNVWFTWRALGEPDGKGVLMSRNARIAIELDAVIPDCEEISIRVRKIGCELRVSM